MEKVTVKSLYRDKEKFIDQEVEISGWIKKIRVQKNFGFIEINDGSFFKGIQIVFDTKLNNFDEISRLSIISSIRVNGKLVRSQGAGQDIEIIANGVEIYQKADLDYPLQNKRHTFEYLRTKAHLRPRTNTFSAVFRVRSVIAYAIHKFSRKMDLYMYILNNNWV